jgi:hypothetical protein
MRWLSFLSKLALIGNFFFLMTVALHFYRFLEDQVLVSTVVIIGYALAVFVFTPLVNILYFVFSVLRKKLFDIVPSWMVITNFIFLLLQIAYIIFFLNGSIYN